MTTKVPSPPKFFIVAWGVSETAFHTKAVVERALTTVSCPRQCVLRKRLDYKKASLALQ